MCVYLILIIVSVSLDSLSHVLHVVRAIRHHSNGHMCINIDINIFLQLYFVCPH